MRYYTAFKMEPRIGEPTQGSQYTLTVLEETSSHLVVVERLLLLLVMVNRGDDEGCGAGQVRRGKLMKPHLAEQFIV